MLYRVNDTLKYTLCSKDGTIGKVKEILFDDRKWAVRYLVADTGGWLRGNKVIISPEYMTELNQAGQCINIDLLNAQIEKSPPLTSDLPVDRQNRQIKDDFFVLPDSPLTKLPEFNILEPELDRRDHEERAAERHSWDKHLRSTQTALKMIIDSPDGEVGHIEDFIIDDQTWVVRYLVVSTGKWWPGHHVLVAPPWINKINWGTSRAFVGIDRENFKELEEFTSIEMLTREYENRLHSSCNRIGYWADDPDCKIPDNM